MPGTEPSLSPLELRKRLLIAESEINRVQLREEWETMAGGIRGVADRAKTIGSYASMAAALAAGVAAFKHSKSKAPAPDENHSWVRTMIKGLRLAASLWLAFRARPRDDHEVNEEEEPQHVP